MFFTFTLNTGQFLLWSWHFLMPGLGLSYSWTEIHSDWLWCGCFCFAGGTSKSSAVYAVFSETFWLVGLYQCELNLLNLNGFSFLNPGLDYTFLDCYWEVSFFYCWGKLQKKERSVYIYIHTHWLLSLMLNTRAKPCGFKEWWWCSGFFWTMIRSNQQTNVAISTTGLVFADRKSVV